MICDRIEHDRVTLTNGSLFTGYGGGLDLAVEEVFDAETIWTSDVDPGASCARRRSDELLLMENWFK